MPFVVCKFINNAGSLAFDSAPISEYPERWHKSIVTYCLLKGTADIPDQHEISVGVALQLQTWQDEIPINFLRVKASQSPDVSFAWVDGKTDPVINGNDSIMAYSSYPTAAGNPIHINFNDDLNWSFSGTNFQWNPLNTILHEFGHALGLVHSPDDANSIMYPMYNGKIELDPLDISRIQAKYGKRTWAAGAYLRISQAVHNWKLRLK